MLCSIQRAQPVTALGIGPHALQGILDHIILQHSAPDAGTRMKRGPKKMGKLGE